MATQIPLMRKLWAEPFVTHQDKYHTLENIGLNQLPSKPVPVWIGGGTEERVMRRIARLADGWLPMGDPAPNVSRMHDYLKEYGREASDLKLMARLSAAQGGPDDWKAEARRLADLGATHITIGVAPDATPAQELATALRVRGVLAG
jgi:alkanesulfonate monooxygenase SsuD/methylene tetrahydromethanopterin reductase-like flavin-dependent oxidoreductase (luciferase family)